MGAGSSAARAGSARMQARPGQLNSTTQPSLGLRTCGSFRHSMPLFVRCRSSSRVIGTPELIRRESGANALTFFMDLHKFARDPRLKDVAFSATFLLEIQVVRRGQPTSRKRVALETYEIIMAGNALVVRFACLARRRHPGLSGAGGRRLSGIRREILS